MKHQPSIRIISALICFALKEEASPFRKITAGKSGVSILLTGIGEANAEKSVRDFLARNSPEVVLTCGFAGGLKPDLKIGDVLFLTAYGDLDKMLCQAGARPASFYSSNHIVATAAEKKAIHEKTGAWAVEMESGAVHNVCHGRGIPCATVRVISDTAGEDLPLDFNLLAKPDKSLDFGKLALAIAKSPGKIGALMELRKKAAFAAERLAAVLGKAILDHKS